MLSCFSCVQLSVTPMDHGLPGSFQFSPVQLLSRVRLFATPWIAARQASLSITNSWSLLKLMSPKECSNYHTITLISHASKVMLKILQARLQQYVNCKLPDVQAGFGKGRGPRDQIANIRQAPFSSVQSLSRVRLFATPWNAACQDSLSRLL